jgi:uncharacterized protein with FMN-binding domain
MVVNHLLGRLGQYGRIAAVVRLEWNQNLSAFDHRATQFISQDLVHAQEENVD